MKETLRGKKKRVMRWWRSNTLSIEVDGFDQVVV